MATTQASRPNHHHLCHRVTLNLHIPSLLAELRAGPSGFRIPASRALQGGRGSFTRQSTPLLAGVRGSRGLASRKREGRYAATGSAERKAGAPKQRAESVGTPAQLKPVGLARPRHSPGERATAVQRLQPGAAGGGRLLLFGIRLLMELFLGLVISRRQPPPHHAHPSLPSSPCADIPEKTLKASCVRYGIKLHFPPGLGQTDTSLLLNLPSLGGQKEWGPART
ncbi:uncharacterized protein [Myotis yumanensis]|uniref:uncharacterized protein n=1 Tax=Myotis yumanensis TaxID=159337 RepID=UPI0038D15F51